MPSKHCDTQYTPFHWHCHCHHHICSRKPSNSIWLKLLIYLFYCTHTHTHWCFITGYTSSTHTYKHVGGRNSLVAFQDGIYLQTSIYTKTQLNKCFACKSLNNRIGCMNTVELHQYGVGIFFLMRWMKKYTHTFSRTEIEQKESERKSTKKVIVVIVIVV